jgi:hypothetical protein
MFNFALLFLELPRRPFAVETLAMPSSAPASPVCVELALLLEHLGSNSPSCCPNRSDTVGHHAYPVFFRNDAVFL